MLGVHKTTDISLLLIMMDTTFTALGDISQPGDYQGALVIVRDLNGNVLMQLRDADKDIVYPGYWSLFGGGLEPGESPAQAAARELAEEIGLIVDRRRLLPHYVTLADAPRCARIYFFSYTAEISPSEIVLNEGSGFAFLTPEQIEHLQVIPYVMNALRHYWRDIHV
ncbi:NUDIX hydrolase [Musicola paradisiaca Ech703]|uniref:NUDIX hydrolase n=2 Tax=Musicola paradisiaca TaxID=69223 RepID=C6C4J7_MUSP7|nr:NUDIX hydrolase [Musicola paradisiaca Ech703]